MQIQRASTYASQSATGSLLTAMAKGDSAERAAFQQSFTQTLDAISAGQRRQQPEEQPLKAEVGGGKVKARQTSRHGETDSTTEPNATAQSAAGTTTTQATESVRSSDRSSDRQDRPENQKVKSAASSSQDDQSPAKDTPAKDAPAQDATATSAALPLANSDDTSADPAAAKVVADAESTPAQQLAAPLVADSSQQATLPGVQTGQGDTPAQDKTPKVDASTLTAPAPAPLSATAGLAVEAQEASVEAAAMSVVNVKGASQSRPGIKAERSSTVERQASVQVGAALVTGDEGPKVNDRQTSKQTNFQQALQPLDLQAQSIRAGIVTVQVISAASGQTADADLSSTTAQVTDIGNLVRPAAAKSDVAGAATDQPAALNQDEQIDRLVQVMRASLSRGGSRVSLQLDPPELGQLRVQMQIRGSELTARFETTTETSRDWLQSNLPQLRDSLAAQGLRLVEVTVESRGTGAENLGNQAGGGTGNFSGGSQAGHPQPQQQQQQQHYSSASAAPEAAVPLWAEPAEDESRLNVVV
jgi:flagellar hook-length control protein FliK